MSEKKFEPCNLEEATHVEVGGKVYEFGDGIVTKIKDGCYPRIRVINESVGNDYINESSFPIFGIKPMKEKKQEPIEFEFIMSLNTLSFFPPLNVPMEAVGKRFRCVQILEEKK